MIKNFMPYVEKMPAKKQSVPWGAWALEIISWTIIFIALSYFGPIVWRILMR